MDLASPAVSGTSVYANGLMLYGSEQNTACLDVHKDIELTHCLVKIQNPRMSKLVLYNVTNVPYRTVVKRI